MVLSHDVVIGNNFETNIILYLLGYGYLPVCSRSSLLHHPVDSTCSTVALTVIVSAFFEILHQKWFDLIHSRASTNLAGSVNIYRQGLSMICRLFLKALQFGKKVLKSVKLCLREDNILLRNATVCLITDQVLVCRLIHW